MVGYLTRCEALTGGAFDCVNCQHSGASDRVNCQHSGAFYNFFGKKSNARVIVNDSPDCLVLSFGIV